MRGVIALAAAVSLPQTLADGKPFPQRSLIVFLTFTVILVTLVLQGLTLPWLIRALGLAGTTATTCEADEARRLVIETALKYLNKPPKESAGSSEIYANLAEYYRHRLASLQCGPGDAAGGIPKQYARYREIASDVMNVEREAALELRRDGKISYEVLREIEKDLDFSAIKLSRANNRRGGETH